MTRTWQNQFTPDYRPPDEVLGWLAGQKDFADSSWGNDVCPSFSADLPEMGEEAHVCLWVDHADPESREMHGTRYAISICAAFAGAIQVCATDDVAEAINAATWTVRMIRSVRAELSKYLADGTLPPDISSYAQVHEHYDGNVLGDFEEGCEHYQHQFGHRNCEESGREFDACRDLFFPICRAVHQFMDYWLAHRHD